MSDETPRKIPRKTWEPFHGLKITPPAEEESKDPEIRDYQQKRYRHEYEGGPEPTAPERPVVLNAPLFGGKKELGKLPYQYAGPVNTALNTLYGMKTKPFYGAGVLAPFAAGIDAYESAKRIQENPYSISSYTGLLPIARSGSPIMGVAGGAGAAYAASQGEEPEAQVDRNRSPVFRRGADEMDAMRLAHGITDPERFSQTIGRQDGPLPMRNSYGTRHGSNDLKDIGFRGPIENNGHQVTEYSVDRDYQYPSIYSGISNPDLKSVLSAERFGQNTPEDVDQRAYGAAQERVSEGRSPFYEPGKDEYPSWSPDQNWEEPAVMRGTGGKTNSILDKNPEWRMSLGRGGEHDVQDALRLARRRLEFGGSPDDYAQGDDRYQAFQQMGGTRVDPRSQAIGRFLPKMTYHESRDNPLAGAKTSSAAGLAQFTKPTWRSTTAGEPEVAGKSREELMAMRRDPSEAGQQFHMRMAEKLANQNADLLEKRGIEITPQNLYGAHFGGPHGVKALAAPASTPLNKIFSPAEIHANRFLRGKTAEDFRNFTQKAMSETPKGLPTDMDFQRSQSPTNRFQNLQTAMAGQPAGGPDASTQMAYQPQPQQMASAAPDLSMPKPSVPASAPTQMAKADIASAKPPQMAAEINVGKPPQQAQMEMPKAPDQAVAGDTQPGAPQEDTQQNFLQSEGVGMPEAAPEAPAPEMPDMTAGLENMFMARGGLVSHALKIAHEAMNKGGGAWTRKEGKNPNGGLNAKGRASLKAQGHDIKPPQPEGGPRKDSFCARMKGMKSKLTSSETANDPNSRINKSLRAWNCHADGGPVWDKPRPKGLGKPHELSSSQKASAKSAAKAAGRPYPNLIDNMRAAKK